MMSPNLSSQSRSSRRQEGTIFEIPTGTDINTLFCNIFTNYNCWTVSNKKNEGGRIRKTLGVGVMSLSPC